MPNAWFHASIPAALRHPAPWAGIAAACASIAETVDGHAKIALVSLSGCAGVVACFLKSPVNDQPQPPQEP